jgi:hypothetical protein
MCNRAVDVAILVKVAAELAKYAAAADTGLWSNHIAPLGGSARPIVFSDAVVQ